MRPRDINIIQMTKDFIREPELAWYYYVDVNFRILYYLCRKEKLQNRHYSRKVRVGSGEGQKRLIEAIEKGQPYMVGRYGGIEGGFMRDAVLAEHGLKAMDLERMEKECINCGFFPPEEAAYKRFKDVMTEAIKLCNLMVIYYSPFENYFCKHYLPKNAWIANSGVLNFFLHEEPFTWALRGKKVLVIHPFEKTIQMQYKKREKLFKNPKLLPEFELHTLKAVQTSAGGGDPRFQTWFEALDFMFEESMKIDFDVALIGCGAYGFPLAARLKAAGKIAIQMGGVTQLLFGIKGMRWDRIEQVSGKLYNEAWVRPLEEEKPEGADKVEGACYW